MKSNNYIQIQGWMVTRLELTGNYLLAYALIYGFSQDGQSEFTGSINYICKWLGCSRNTAIKVLKELTDKNLIDKTQIEVNNVTFNKYSANLTSAGSFDKGSAISAPPVQKVNGGSAKSALGGSAISAPNNNIYNTNDNNSDFDVFISEIGSSTHQMWRESFYMKFKLKPGSLSDLLQIFKIHLGIKDQSQPKNLRDFKEHFYNWCNVQDRISKLDEFKKGKKEGAL